MANSKLYEELQGADAGLAKYLGRIRDEALWIWKENPKYFTDHGGPHFSQVEANLDSLTRALQASQKPLSDAGKPLSPEEIFVLLAACYLHDIGMHINRARHAEISEDLILRSNPADRNSLRKISEWQDLFVTLSIPNDNARAAIGKVAKGHWSVHAVTLEQEDYIFGNQLGRLRLLAVLLSMADLLDLSPERARYYLSPHRLETLPPLSELHQTMHRLVKGFRILAPNLSVPGELQLQLTWRDDQPWIRDIADWVMTWAEPYWRQLRDYLKDDSGGTIRWTKPWARVKFEQTNSGLTLSPGAELMLRAERAELARWDREQFLDQYSNKLKSSERAVFVFPNEPKLDAAAIAEWCELQGRLCEGCRAARVDLRPEVPDTLGIVAAQLLAQWDVPIDPSPEADTLERLRAYLSVEEAPVAAVLVSESERASLLTEIAIALMERPHSSPPPARAVLIISRDEVGFDAGTADFFLRFDGGPFTEEEVLIHMEKKWGYVENEGRGYIEDLRLFDSVDNAGMVRTFMRGKREAKFERPQTTTR
ncbi:MAG TPA: HD domain-containing protein [Longimicrobium sp.]